MSVTTKISVTEAVRELDAAAERTSTTVYLPCDNGQPVPHPSALKVLVVDDDRAVRTFTKAALERLGHNALLAENGKEALEVLRGSQAVDLVLLDMVMPEVGGAEVFAEIQARWPGLPVVVVSGYSHEEAQRVGIPNNQPFLAKPYTVQSLASAIENASAHCS